MTSPPAKRTKVTKWDQEYLSEWESDPLLAGWLTKSKRTPGKAFCTLCNKDLEYKKGGLYDLKRHGTRDAHVKAAKARELQGSILQPRTQNTLAASAANGVLKAAFFLAEHHIPVSAADHLVDLIKAICPDSKIASEMVGARTKMTAAIMTVAEAMHGDLVKMISGSYFAILPDESTDVAVKEQVAIAVRVFDDERGLVQTQSFGLRSVSRPNAQEIFRAIEGLIRADKVPWSETLLAYCSDGANVMCGRHNSVLTRLKDIQPNIWSLHCTCHAIHLCAEAACKEFLPPRLQDWLSKMAYFFDRSAKRTVSLVEAQDACGTKRHKLVKPAQTRWLSLQGSVARTLEQWDTQLYYFTTDSDVKNREDVKRWLEWMKEPETKAYLLFLNEALALFTNFNKLFQTTKVVIHILYEELLNLHRMLLLNCVTPSAVRAASSPEDQIKLDVNSRKIQLRTSEVVICQAACDVLASLPRDRQEKFFDRCRGFYSTSVLQVS